MPRHAARIALLMAGCLALLTTLPAGAAPAVYRCEVDGVVTFQQQRCAPADPGSRPTAAQLNAERRQRLAREAAVAASAAAASAAAGQVITASPGERPSNRGEPAFRCDGRRYCSQMRSCAEATFFLRNCPDTHMDGDGDGVPCERQWCGL